MYLEEINDENLGPIDQLKIKMNFELIFIFLDQLIF